MPSVFVLALAAYGGFGNTLSTVHRTVDTANAAGEAINGSPAQAQPAGSAAGQVAQAHLHLRDSGRGRLAIQASAKAHKDNKATGV